mmetsp:Transcript_53076/g.149541  ORF Transcript_53076/g.149541 Transcript_53076/m.149541 type:complete len:205 (-) Transcript_53076:676-1290(-)
MWGKPGRRSLQTKVAAGESAARAAAVSAAQQAFCAEVLPARHPGGSAHPRVCPRRLDRSPSWAELPGNPSRPPSDHVHSSPRTRPSSGAPRQGCRCGCHTRWGKHGRRVLCKEPALRSPFARRGRGPRRRCPRRLAANPGGGAACRPRTVLRWLRRIRLPRRQGRTPAASRSPSCRRPQWPGTCPRWPGIQRRRSQTSGRPPPS